MSATAVLAIVVAVGEARNPASTALLDAARESLGATTAIRVVESNNLSDAGAIRVESDLGASAVVVLSWKEPGYLHAVIRFHLARANRWTTRSISFDSSDTLSERGRTLGFAVASMTPEKANDPTPPVRPSPSPAPTPQSQGVPTSASSALPSPARPPSPSTPRVTARAAERPPEGSTSPPFVTEPPKAEAPKAAAPPSPARVPLAPSPSPAELIAQTPAKDQELTADSAAKSAGDGRRVPAPKDTSSKTEIAAAHLRPRPFGIGIATVGSLGLGGPQSALGGKLGVAWFPAPRVGVRGDVGLRVGPLPALTGSDRLGSLGIGLEWWPVTDRTRAAWGFGVRADALLTEHQVTGTVPGGRAETRYRFLPGADFVIQAFVGLNHSWDLTGGVALEGVLGATDIRTGDARVVVATIPAIRVVGELGLRLRF